MGSICVCSSTFGGQIPRICINREEKGSDLLGTLLMALSGRKTRTVRTAEKLTFCRSREYSSILQKTQTQRSVKDLLEKCYITKYYKSNIIRQPLTEGLVTASLPLGKFARGIN